MTNDIIKPDELQETIREMRIAIEKNKEIGQQLNFVFTLLLELVEPKESRIGGN